MIPAPDLELILNRAHVAVTAACADARLVSVLFAPPSSPVWTELHKSAIYLDHTSGRAWDLFLAGISAFDVPPSDGIPIGTDSDDHARLFFHTEQFLDLRTTIEHEHAAACPDSPWRYSGGTEIISFFATYTGTPDWTTLRSDVLAHTPTALSEATHKHLQGDDEDLFPYDPKATPVPYKPGALKHGLTKHATAAAVSVTGKVVATIITDGIGIGS